MLFSKEIFSELLFSLKKWLNVKKNLWLYNKVEKNKNMSEKDKWVNKHIV